MKLFIWRDGTGSEYVVPATNSEYAKSVMRRHYKGEFLERILNQEPGIRELPDLFVFLDPYRTLWKT
jgi:hypothetical protein